MINEKKVIVVMPAFNAGHTLEKVYAEIPHAIVDEIILTDDKSSDETVIVSKRLGITTFEHKHNKGYGANQKTCYKAALSSGADIIVMLHPDYQYNPRLITAMASLISEGVYDVVIGSRILGTGAIQGGMPRYKYYANRFLTAFQNVLIGQKLSEYHTGYRAFSRQVLQTIPLIENSDDFIFDNQMMLQTLYFGFRVAEISCPTVYNKDSSSINFSRSALYGFGVLLTTVQYVVARIGVATPKIFSKSGKTLSQKV